MLADVVKKIIFRLSSQLSVLFFFLFFFVHYIHAGNAPAPTASAAIRGLEEIKSSGVLRVLTMPDPELAHLQRGESIREQELALLESLADWLKVRLHLIQVVNYEQLIPALVAGKGDIIAANMTITPERQAKVIFSLPIETLREQLVVSVKAGIRNLNELNSKSIVIENGTSYWRNAAKLRQRFPGLGVIGVDTDTETLIGQVASGNIELTIADDNYIDNYLTYRSDIKTIYTFPEKCEMALAMHRKSGQLKAEIDAFLRQELPYRRVRGGRFDLPAIKRRRIIRVITSDNPVNYFIHRGRLMGFEYDLVKKFADEYKLHLVMITPPHSQQMIPWLLEGKGDLIAASLTATEERKNVGGMAFGSPYMDVNEVVVTRKNDSSLKSIADLKGRTFVVRAGSSYLETLEKLKAKGHSFNISVLSGEEDSFEILSAVAEGKYDLTLVDDVYLKAKLQGGDDIKAVLTLATGKKYAWAVRRSSPELLAAVNAFFKKEYRGTFFNMMRRKYFDVAKEGVAYQEKKENGQLLSPFDDIVRRHAGDNNFDWCMITSQIFQESRFDHKIVAPDGGMGLMQLMPATAKQLNCNNPLDPDSNVRAGTLYMNKLRSRFDDRVKPIDQLCFALASYNGGYGHVADARILAAEMKLDPNVWRNNVEEAMKKLSTSTYASRARYGFCRSDIINKYVQNIMLRYYHYQQMVKNGKTESADTENNSKKD